MTEKLSDREQICDVIVRYATGIDTLNWPLFRTCFTADVHADYGPIGVWDGVDAITDWMAATHKDMASTKHLMTNLVIDIDGNEATANTYVHAVLVVRRDPDVWVDAIGQYADRLLRTAEGWRIRQRVFTMTRHLSSS